MSTIKWGVIENIVIYLTVLAAFLSGLVFFDTKAGLWFLLLLLFVNSYSYEAEKKK